MPQHKMKTKVNLPKDPKQKLAKKAQILKNKVVPKKGSRITIAPKRQAAVQQAKVAAVVSKVINEKNEEMLRNRADKDQGRTSKPKN